MANPSQSTGTPEPTQPVSNEPVTEPNGSVAAPKDGDETITLSKKDHNELIAQRDRANEALRSSSDSEEFLIEIAKEREIGSFLKDHKEKYPDLTLEDLKSVNDPSELEATADRIQGRYQEISQKKLQEMQVADKRPVLTEEQKDAQLKKLRGSGDPQAFSKMVELRTDGKL